MTTPTRETVLAELRSLASGITKNMSSVTITLAGVSYTGSELVTRLQVSIDAAMRVQSAQATLRGALAAEEIAVKGEHAFIMGAREIIATRYSNSTVTLNDFGMQPRKKRRPMTNEEAVLRAAKSRATREKRGTLGKRQKAAIKGNVTGVVITPMTTGNGGNGGNGEE